MDLLHTDLTERKSYIGKKFIGFKFESQEPKLKGLRYDKKMYNFIGEELEITGYDREYDSFKTEDFGVWYYPAKLVIEQLNTNNKTEDEIIKDVFSIINRLK